MMRFALILPILNKPHWHAVFACEIVERWSSYWFIIKDQQLAPAKKGYSRHFQRECAHIALDNDLALVPASLLKNELLNAKHQHNNEKRGGREISPAIREEEFKILQEYCAKFNAYAFAISGQDWRPDELTSEDYYL